MEENLTSYTLSQNCLTPLIKDGANQAMAWKLCAYLVGFFLLLFPMSASCAALLETFEGEFVSSSPYGSIPVGWTASSSTLVSYSKSSEHYDGNYSLGAAVSYDSQYYAVLRRTFLGFTPGDVVTLSIKVKCATSSRAEGSLSFTSGATTTSSNNYWYSYSPSEEWRTAELKDIVVPSSGELFISLRMANDYGTSTFHWDALTITAGQNLTGSLHVTISSQGASNAGAQWRRVGTDAWQNSSTTETEVPVGSYTVEFKDVSGWIKPENQSVTIISGQTTSVSGTYVANRYSVTPSAGAGGTISPATVQTVSHGSTKVFTVTPNTGYTASVGGTCGGTLNGTTYTTNAITGACTVSATFSKGDVNGDSTVNLADAIVALKVIAGMNSAGIRPDYSTSGADVNSDGRIGMEEVIYILQKIAAIRTSDGGPTAPAGMVLIPAGSFQMGDAIDGMSWAMPVHTVTMSAFYLDEYEVTKALWDEVYTWATANVYAFDKAGTGMAATHPVQYVSWYDVVKWLNARSEKEGRTPVYYTDSGQGTVYRAGQVDVAASAVKWAANGYRLPTEAEWEYAARAGTTTRFYTGNCISTDQANYDGRSPETECPAGQFRGTTTAVGSFPANPWGLYDMAGNVSEWIWDWHGSYSSTAAINPQGPASGSSRVFRVSNFGNSASHVRSANRNGSTPSNGDGNIGFRSALSQP